MYLDYNDQGENEQEEKTKQVSGRKSKRAEKKKGA